MTTQQKIRGALDTHLSTAPDLPPVAFENSNFEPVPGQTYAEAYLMPRNPANPTLGLQMQDLGGVYQISLYFPRGADTGEMDNLAGALQNHFYAGLILHAATMRVLIERTPAIAAGMPSGDRWLVPVSVRYRCLT